MSATVLALPCRRCTECTDETHHWMMMFEPDAEPCWGCKHCDYTCETVSCEACDEEIPIDIATVEVEDGCYFCPKCVDDLAAAEVQ
jgi:hypothetical protein